MTTTTEINGATLRQMTAAEFRAEYGFAADFSRLDGDQRDSSLPPVAVRYERQPNGSLRRTSEAYNAHQAETILAECVPTYHGQYGAAEAVIVTP